MVIIMRPEATPNQIDRVVERIKSVGLNAQPSIGEERTVIGVIGDKTRLVDIPIESMSGVERTTPISAPYKLASRQFRDEPTTIEVNGTKIGEKQVVVMAGPCAVESTEQIVHIAKEIAKSGATFIRGGAFKPRTGPYSFQGYGEPALKMLVEAKQESGLGIITEVMTPGEVELVSKYTDIFQLGTRNMQNFYLLREVGKSGKPVVLKRGLSATIEEWLLAAEYILSEGNPNVILCERGIRTFETHTRNTLDLNAVPAIKELSHLPIVVDPSHGTGIRSLVAPMAKASIAAGADGLLLEVHHDPDNSITGDGVQSLFPDQFDKLMQELQTIAGAIGREM
jgi:3-deoxy-7-phosphoheptulonate synthase